MIPEEKALQDKVNKLIDQTVYLHLMGSFVPWVDFRQIKDVVTSVYDFVKTESEEKVQSRLPELINILQKMTSPLVAKFPLKRDLGQVAFEFNAFFISGNDIYSYGLEFGWLDSQMDLSELKLYSDTPFHYRIGIAAHKGNGSIEEDFLLKDSFNILVKACYYQTLLLDYGKRLKELEEKKDKKEFSEKLYHQIANLKFEVAADSRLSVISFYAFVEGFVNSVGHSYLSKNIDSLSESEKELLSGFKKGRFLPLKSKIEKFQSIIRHDKTPVIIVSDDAQIPEDFKQFFDYYEQLRNSAMHYSPIKERIWMRPQEWVDKAIEFGKLSTKVSLEFWRACYPTSEGPHYLGKLSYELHLKKATERLAKIQQIETERRSW